MDARLLHNCKLEFRQFGLKYDCKPHMRRLMSLGRRYRAERKLHFRARNLYKLGVDDPQREQTVASVETTVLETNRSLHHFHGPKLQILVAMLSQYDILFTSQKIISVLV